MKKLLILLLLTITLYSQQTEKVTAKIGNISISENDFRYRYELVPRLNSPINPNSITEKKNFLYGLITEKLLSLGARENKLDTVEIVINTIKSYEKMFVRDALYRKEVLNKSVKYAEELLSFYLDHPNSLLTRYICYTDSIRIHNLSLLFNKGVSFDSIYSGLSKYEKDTMTITAGQLDDNIEHTLFSLYEESISSPVKIKDGWYVFYIEKANTPVSAKLTGWETEYKRLERAAKEKAEFKYYKQYVSSFFKNKQIDANGFLLKSFADKISSILAQKESALKQGEKLFLEIQDIIKIQEQFGRDSLEQVFVKIPGRSIKFKEYINWYRTENFSSVNSENKRILGLLNGKTKKFIEEELFYDEGIKQGLDKDPSVQNDISMWRDSYLSQLMSVTFRDSVNSTGTDNYNIQDTTSVMVNIIEVLTDNLDKVEKILNEIRSGSDIKEVAALYGIRDEFKYNKGESGYFNSGMYGDIGRIAAGMNVGDVYGPLKVPEGYSVFKLIGKKKSEAAFALNTPENKKELEIREKLNNYTASLARRYGIEINEAVLEEIKTTKITSLVFRYLGFGGKITAVPFNSTDIEWTKTFKDKKDL